MTIARLDRRGVLLPIYTVPRRPWIITRVVRSRRQNGKKFCVLLPTTHNRSPDQPHYEPDRAPLLAHSAPGLAVVATTVLPQHDAAPKVTRRHSQLRRERSIVVRPVGNHRPDRRPIAISAGTAARAHRKPPGVPAEPTTQAEGAPATRLSSRRSGRMPERDRPPSASCAWTVETSTWSRK